MIEIQFQTFVASTSKAKQELSKRQQSGLQAAIANAM
jgi:hypothetical protein